MSNVVVPQLGGAGWISDPAQQLNTMMAYAITSNYSQSTIYKGKVTSIPYILAQYQNNQAELVSHLQSSLTEYFYPVFDSVTVDVSADLPDARRYNIYITIEVTKDSKVYNLAVTAPVDNGVLAKTLVEINA